MIRLFAIVAFLFASISVQAEGVKPVFGNEDNFGGGPSFTLTPNPVSGSYFSVNLDFSSSQFPDAVIIISDVLGKTVYLQPLKQSDFMEGRVRISVMDANLDKGVYFLQIKSGDATKTQKLAIR